MVKPVVLIILDGWGIAPPGPGNAISQAKLTHIPSFWNSYPHCELAASGEAVGLPSGEDGNTETGHMNIGAGRVVYQDLPRINMTIADGSFYRNDAFLAAIRHARNHESNIHLMGVVSDAGVHASRDHLFALLELMRREGRTGHVCLHVFTDGRDAPPKSALRFVTEVSQKCALLGVGAIATVMGRFYGMDRDRRWDRTEQAYRTLTEYTSRVSKSATAAVEDAYSRGITDEFIEPTIILGDDGKPLPRIAGNDAVIFYNYRIDRPRQLTRAFVLPNFETSTKQPAFDPYTVKYYHKHIIEEDFRSKPFKRRIVLSNLFFVTMTEYERDLPCTVAFPLEPLSMTIGHVFSQLKMRQLRVAETEKERFVGYYFNGMHETPCPGEDRMIIPSPKVATYDLMPQMSAKELTDKVLDRLSLDIYSFIVVNFANPDMVAHTGNITAAVTACEVVDYCVGEIVTATLNRGGSCIITADHGNVEEMLGSGSEMDTEHSTFPVPFIIVAKKLAQYPYKLPVGKLADVAPTILAHMGLTIPSEMTGKNLLADFSI